MLIRWLGLVQTLGLVSATLALTAAALPRPSGRPWVLARVLAWVLALAGLLLTLPPIADRLDLSLERVASLVAEVKAPSRECYIISDSQELSWREFSDRTEMLLREIERADDRLERAAG